MSWSRLIAGTMKKLDTTTIVEPEAGGTRLMDYRQSIPDVRAPLGVVRPFVGSATRKTLAELRAEMLRRKQEAERGTVREKAEG
jgi:hypothetical protein